MKKIENRSEKKYILKIRFLKNRSIFFNLLSLYTLTIQENTEHPHIIIKEITLNNILHIYEILSKKRLQKRK